MGEEKKIVEEKIKYAEEKENNFKAAAEDKEFAGKKEEMLKAFKRGEDKEFAGKREEMLKAFKRGEEKSQQNKKSVDEDKERQAHEADLNEDKIIVDRFNNIIKEVDQQKSTKEEEKTGAEKTGEEKLEEMLNAFKSGKEESQKNREINYIKKAAEDKERQSHESDLNEDHIVASRFNNIIKEVDQQNSTKKEEKTCDENS